VRGSSRGADRFAVRAATLGAAALIAQQVAGKATRDTLFLSAFQVKSLPAVMIASSLVSILAVVGFSRDLVRRSPARAVPAALAAAFVLLLGEWALTAPFPRAAAILVYLHMAFFGSVLVSGFWSVVNERFDPYAAKRAVGRIAMGASLGGVAGGFLTWGFSDVLPPAAMLLVMAALSIACLVAILQVQPPAGARSEAPPDDDADARPLAGLRILREVPYLRQLALLVGLCALTETLLDYVFKSEAVKVYDKGPELLSFFALFHTGVGLMALLAQTTLARPALESLGLAGTVGLRAAAVGLGGMAAVVVPGLWSVTATRAVDALLQNSLFRSAYELLFTPLPERQKRSTKAIVDVGFDKLGAVLGGLVTLAAVALLHDWTRVSLLSLSVLSGLVALLLSRRLHRGYIGALEDSLRSGKLKLDEAEILDSTTRLTLYQTNMGLDRETLLREIKALRKDATPSGTAGVAPREPSADPLLRRIDDVRSGELARVRRALGEGEDVPPYLVAHLIPLLSRNDVFLDVLRTLRKAAPRATGQLLDALLDPEESPTVRRRLPRVLKTCPTQRAADGLIQGLQDERFDVRYQCGLALLRITERNPEINVPAAAIFAVAVRELDLGRVAWETAAAPVEDSPGGATLRSAADRGLEHVFTLLSLVLERESLQLSSRAVRGEDPGLRGTALEYLENVLPDRVREALFPHLGVRARGPRPARPREQVVDELRRSVAGMVIDRSALRRKTPKE
jgi:AAA family ATP:ADP antiporter